MADNTEQDEQIIELTDIVDDVDAVSEDQMSDDGILELTDIDAASDALVGEDVLPDGAAVSQQQLEAALERIIEKKFSQKIEAILFDVMERVISKEITEIRENLQKDLDQIGTS
ncbi:MAG: hypothetical protein LC657_14745 [Desulfobacteraceae bacterium]|nr:hypothetical protein [Desulfobacteraceae bacterium]